MQQLLDLARLEPDERAAAPAPVDVALLARDVVGAYAGQAEALGVDLGAETSGTAIVVGAESELRSLFANLVDSQVTVSVRKNASAIEIAVVDAGRGIPVEERERMFQRFQRIPGDPTRGSGLGLPIVKAIAERHRGSIVLADAHPGQEPPGLAVRVRLDAGEAVQLVESASGH